MEDGVIESRVMERGTLAARLVEVNGQEIK